MASEASLTPLPLSSVTTTAGILVDVRLRPMGDIPNKAVTAGFLVCIPKDDSLQPVQKALADWFDLPDHGIKLIYEGADIDVTKNLSGNSVTLPGPARRRAGEKVELFFALLETAVEEKRQKEERQLLEAQQLLDLQTQAQRDQDRRLQAIEAEKLARLKQEEEESSAPRRYQVVLERRLGLSRQAHELIISNQKPNDEPVEERSNFLEMCTEELRAEVELLMNNTSRNAGRYKVVTLLRNENSTLQFRYQRARSALSEAKIAKMQVCTGQSLVQLEQLKHNLSLNPDINEFALWHGTTSLDAAGGICKTGFDIGFAGSACGTVMGHGFYFAEQSAVSHGYTRPLHDLAGLCPTGKHASLYVMLLCKVLCGNPLDLPDRMNEEEKEKLTAKCMGPGGSFGSKSDHHCILGNISASKVFVAFHRDQVLPEYVILYTM